jgi:hypothetical protein
VVVVLAVPPLSVTVAIVFVPSLNVIDPVASEGSTVAVRVTVWPTTAGLGVNVRLVTDTPCVTVCVIEVEVLPVSLVSPA